MKERITIEFKKYPSIENHYRTNNLNKMLFKFPKLLTEEFILTEKVDGCNFSFCLSKNNPVKYARRTAFLKPDEKFYSYQHYVEQFQTEIDALQYYVDNAEDIQNMKVCCEFYGSHILNRVEYGEGGFKIFDIYINEKLLSPKSTIELLMALGLGELYVPIIAKVKGFQNAIDFEINEINSLILSDCEEKNIIEGVVIKPYKMSYLDGNNSPLYIKKKTPVFLEKEKRKTHKSPKVIDNKLLEVQEVFSTYLTESRVLGIVSKYGMIESPKQIGEYIKYVLNDAKEDFIKDEMGLFISLEEKNREKVFGACGKKVVPILQKLM